MITFASKQNLDEIIEIANEQFKSEAWTKSQFESEFEQNNRIFLVFTEKNKVIAYLIAMINQDEVEILDIAVKSDFQGKGVASALLNEVFDKLQKNNVKKYFLEVKEDNIKAISLYKKFLFKEIYIRKKYYKDGKNAIIMEKKC